MLKVNIIIQYEFQWKIVHLRNKKMLALKVNHSFRIYGENNSKQKTTKLYYLSFYSKKDHFAISYWLLYLLTICVF